MTTSRNRPTTSPVSEQMRAWSSALAAEIADWPGVDARSFFGFTALYRGTYMFGALPRTRSWGRGNGLAFKIENLSSALRARLEKDGRIRSMQVKNVRWFSLEMSSDTDLHDALEWLGRAYDAAGKLRKST